MIDIEEAAKQAIERPSDFAYWGDNDELFDTWGLTISRHRDSDALERSNFEVIFNDLKEKYPDDIQLFGASHWAVGWIDRIEIRVYENSYDVDCHNEITDAFKCLYEWMGALEDYPVADESHYSELEYDEFCEYIKEYCYPHEERYEKDTSYWLVPIEDIPNDWEEKMFRQMFDNYSYCSDDDVRWKDVQEAWIDEGWVSVENDSY